MQSLWASRTPEEQRTLKIASLILGLLLTYYLILEPLWGYTQNLKNQVLQNRKLISSLSKANVPLEPTMAKLIIPKNLQAFLTQQTNNSLVFTDAPFDPCLMWLATPNAPIIKSLQATPGSNRGLANLSLKF